MPSTPQRTSWPPAPITYQTHPVPSEAFAPIKTKKLTSLSLPTSSQTTQLFLFGKKILIMVNGTLHLMISKFCPEITQEPFS
jgi:hypothetical protein